VGRALCRFHAPPRETCGNVMSFCTLIGKLPQWYLPKIRDHQRGQSPPDGLSIRIHEASFPTHSEARLVMCQTK
jgi:hypothetical protein